jgi:UDP-glucuronate decarboxylase
MGETLCFDYARKHSVSVAVARIFNTYGPRMSSSDGRVVTNFISQALQNKPLTIYGTGKQTRSFCYCKDLVEGLVALMNSSEQGPINLGNPEEMTITELANIIVKLVKPDAQVVHKPLPIDDPQRRKPAIERAENLIGWKPKVGLEEGLKATIAEVMKQLKQTELQTA